MNKIFLSFVVSGSLLASNYKLVPLSSDGIALSSSNLAKSFSADAAFINPANMGFLGQNPQLHFSANYYNVTGSRFENHLTEVGGEPYYNASDAHGKEFTFFLPTLAFVYPINEQHFVGFAGYTDFAGVYGWNSDYAKALTDTMDIRGGTLALSYAFKPTSELSLGASITANHTRLKFSLMKDNAMNPRYTYKNDYPIWTYTDKDGNLVERHKSWVYSGNVKTDNGYKFGYKLSLTYAPKYFDEKLRFSLLYNSSYKNEFKGNMDFKMTKFAMYDFASAIMYAPQSNGDSIASIMPKFDFAIKNNPALLNNPKFQELLGMATGLGSLKYDMDNGNFDKVVGYNGYASANFLYPANANFGIAYEYGKHEFMFNMGRTFWSKSKSTDLKIATPQMPKSLELLAGTVGGMCAGVNPATGQALPQASNCSSFDELQKVVAQAITMLKAQNQLSDRDTQQMQEYFFSSVLQASLENGWKDTTLLSFGYRYNYDKDLSLMLGFSTEDSPVRREKISFLAKDSRMYNYSLGFEYRINKQLKVTGAGAYQHYADVKVDNVTDNILIQTKGKFSNQSNQIVNFGVNYEF
ncbi:outer membrane transporter (OMPP1/FadL/TodX family) [Campylobacter sp. RM5004]|uniref:OmpP1/FadL family transporter n=1 Tax=Campylobacter sp. RM5004 TaxID=1660078 RepID=UPI001EFA8BC7|nr:outer membrane protein transport protein [Campylobacter sp. RM5004]ULO02238.1 outer membrane transporter (OMPP1/FadL/TodX family) [Campylobacter sp. RM5004]